MRTYSPKASEITRSWHVIDAEGLVLGRLATVAASLLRGKHRATFASHLDSGDYVIIVNAAKVAITANKGENQRWRHSGYPGGIKSTSWQQLLDGDPVQLVEGAVKGMVPHNRLGRAQISKLFVYAGAEHPHAAQQPAPYDTAAIRRA